MERLTTLQIEQLNRALKLPNINIGHWGAGACMLHIELSEDLYACIQLDEIRFTQKQEENEYETQEHD